MNSVENAPQITPLTWTGRSRPNVDHAWAPKNPGSLNLVEMITPTVGASIAQKKPHGSHWRMRPGLISASLRAIARATSDNARSSPETTSLRARAAAMVSGLSLSGATDTQPELAAPAIGWESRARGIPARDRDPRRAEGRRDPRSA